MGGLATTSPIHAKGIWTDVDRLPVGLTMRRQTSAEASAVAPVTPAVQLGEHMRRRRAPPKVEGQSGRRKVAHAASAAETYDGENDFPLDDLPPDDLPVRDITLPPLIFPGRPERWWGNEALKAETDAPQTTLEQRHQAASDVLALRHRGFFSAGARVSRASHSPVETAQ